MKSSLSLFSALFFLILLFQSCTNYQEEAAKFIREQGIQESVIMTQTNGMPKFVMYATPDAIKYYDIRSGSLSNIIQQSGITSWYTIRRENNPILLVFSDSYASAWQLSFAQESLSPSKKIEGTTRKDPFDDNTLVFTTNERTRFKMSLITGSLTKINNVGEFLTAEKIRESVIYKIYDDKDRNCVFYKPSGILFTGDLFCYDAFTGRKHTYSNCHTIYDETDDGKSIIISTKGDGEYSLKKIDTYTGRIETISTGSQVESYRGGFRVKKYDLSEEFYDGNGYRTERPEPQSFVSALLDALFN